MFLQSPFLSKGEEAMHGAKRPKEGNDGSSGSSCDKKIEEGNDGSSGSICDKKNSFGLF